MKSKTNKQQLGALKSYRPTSAGRRHRTVINKKGLHKGSSLGPLTDPIKKTGYRNNLGRITICGRGGKNTSRRKYRKIDFDRTFLDGVKGVITRLEYDPNRTAWIALAKYKVADVSAEKLENLPDYIFHDKEQKYSKRIEGKLLDNKFYLYSYIIAPAKIRPGDTVFTDTTYSIKFGNGCATTLSEIPLGSAVHNVKFLPTGRSAMARSAGSFVKLVGKEGGQSILKLPSGETRKVSSNCRATIGIVSNENNHLTNFGKAGAARYKGRKSTSRGVKMNPVDHHNGGRAKGGKILSNFKGNMRKGQRTRSKKKYSSSLIIKRRPNKHDK